MFMHLEEQVLKQGVNLVTIGGIVYGIHLGMKRSNFLLGNCQFCSCCLLFPKCPEMYGRQRIKFYGR